MEGRVVGVLHESGSHTLLTPFTSAPRSYLDLHGCVPLLLVLTSLYRLFAPPHPHGACRACVFPFRSSSRSHNDRSIPALPLHSLFSSSNNACVPAALRIPCGGRVGVRRRGCQGPLRRLHRMCTVRQERMLRRGDPRLQVGRGIGDRPQVQAAARRMHRQPYIHGCSRVRVCRLGRLPLRRGSGLGRDEKTMPQNLRRLSSSFVMPVWEVQERRGLHPVPRGLPQLHKCYLLHDVW